jgi:hypothetical protein
MRNAELTATVVQLTVRHANFVQHFTFERMQLFASPFSEYLIFSSSLSAYFKVKIRRSVNCLKKVVCSAKLYSQQRGAESLLKSWYLLRFSRNRPVSSGSEFYILLTVHHVMILGK